jgi:hypothetical protein
MLSHWWFWLRFHRRNVTGRHARRGSRQSLVQFPPSVSSETSVAIPTPLLPVRFPLPHAQPHGRGLQKGLILLPPHGFTLKMGGKYISHPEYPISPGQPPDASLPSGLTGWTSRIPNVYKAPDGLTVPAGVVGVWPEEFVLILNFQPRLPSPRPPGAGPPARCRTPTDTCGR